MSLFEDLDLLSTLSVCFGGVKGQLDNMLSETVVRLVAESLSTKSCSTYASDACRDDAEALSLKFIAIGSILIGGVTGISIPLLGRRCRSGFLSTDSNLFVAAKAFAAGVILATGFVHMLPDASANLTSSCLPTYPWSKFPFSGFITMCSALLTLVADFVGTQIYERKQGKEKLRSPGTVGDELVRDGSSNLISEAGVDRVGVKGVDDGNTNGMHIVGMYGHAGRHGHNHPPNEDKRGGTIVVSVDQHQHLHGNDDEDDDGHGHSHGFGGGRDDDGGRHAVVSQVLELGIVSHSVIIGLSIGVSHSPCTIRPLVAALSFHQFFEGFALGGCISEANFKTLKTTLMACFFALTTPSGIAVGISIASSYDPSSIRAIAVEGILDSVSAGILIYMSLVDLIAADFMSKKMRCNVRLQVVSYFALFMGAILMSSLAIWS